MLAAACAPTAVAPEPPALKPYSMIAFEGSALLITYYRSVVLHGVVLLCMCHIKVHGLFDTPNPLLQTPFSVAWSRRCSSAKCLLRARRTWRASLAARLRL